MVQHIVVKLILCLMIAGLVVPGVSGARTTAQAEPNELLLYCGITMVRPMAAIAKQFEGKEKVRVTIAQGGSEDLYQSAKKSRQGDLYLPGEPEYRAKHVSEGLLGEYVVVGYNQLALMVHKGNPKKVKPSLNELLRKDLRTIIGNPESGSIGQATRKALEKAGIYRKVLEKAVMLAPDSRSINLAMKKDEADVTMNWRATGFFSDNSPVIDVIDLDPRIAQPEPLMLTLLTFSRKQDLARRFMDFASSPEGQAVFRSFGFHDTSYLPAEKLRGGSGRNL